MADVVIEIPSTPGWRVLEPLKSFGRYVVQDRAWWQERVQRAIQEAGLAGRYRLRAVQVEWGTRHWARGAEKEARFLAEVERALLAAGLELVASDPESVHTQPPYGKRTTRLTLEPA